jgi:AraC-like DNA-binding protein
MIVAGDAFRRLCRARDLLRDRIDEPLTVAELARGVRISPFHLIRQFEAVFGLTPHQYRTRVRLHAAKRLLASGGYSVTDVCMEVGFSSLGSFSALFSRHVGESPDAYRRRVRMLVQSAALPLVHTPGCLALMTMLPTAAFALRRNFREA